MDKILCIYHGNCADGFGAAWVVRHALGAHNVEFFAGFYDRPPPDVTGRNVLMVDFSYKRPIIESMAKKARGISIIDHHKTAAEDLAEYLEFPFQPEGSIGVKFDMTRSGAGLTWDMMMPPGTPRPRLIEHIEDRDLWKFKLENTREIQACIFSHPYNFDVWDKLVDLCETEHGRAMMITEGAAIQRKHMKDISELLGVAQTRAVIFGYNVPVCNLSYLMSSEAGHLMAEGEPFAACYMDTRAGRVWSLRSAPDGIDVSKVAAYFGGGGHEHAAGFTLRMGDSRSTDIQYLNWPSGGA